MGEFNLDTKAPSDQTVVINGARYDVIGMTRSIQRKAVEKQQEAKRIERQAQAATNGKLPELNEQAAALMIEVVAMRLRPQNGDEPAREHLMRLWEADDLEADRHLKPLIAHLYGEETQPVPPA